MWSTEQNPINVFLVHERKMVPQHKLCIRMVLTPKVRLDSNETARLTTTTRALPIPESGPSISNQTLLIFRKTVHNCPRTNIASWATTIEVVATYEHTGRGSHVRAVIVVFRFARKGPRIFGGRVCGGGHIASDQHAGPLGMSSVCDGVIARKFRHNA